MAILAGSIEKKRTVLALFTHSQDEQNQSINIDDSKEQPIVRCVYDNAELLDNFSSIIERFLNESQFKSTREEIFGACFGIAGPVDENGLTTIRHPSKDITFSETDLRNQFPVRGLPVKMMNDMEAIGYGIVPKGGADQLKTVHAGDKEAEFANRRALMLVTGGLGQALWTRPNNKQERWSPIASEGGHADFADSAILRGVSSPTQSLSTFLAKRKEQEQEKADENNDPGPISKEYVLSSPGLKRIYDFFKECGQYEGRAFHQSQDPSATEIIEAACQPNPLPACQDALKLFIQILGSEAGNLALQYYAQGGVFIVLGDDLPIPLDKFQQNAFLEAFMRKEPKNAPFREILRKIPIKFYTDRDVVLWGAARYAIESGFVIKGKFAAMRSKR